MYEFVLKVKIERRTQFFSPRSIRFHSIRYIYSCLFISGLEIFKGVNTYALYYVLIVFLFKHVHILFTATKKYLQSLHCTKQRRILDRS